MTDLRQAAQQALDAWDNPTGMKRLCVAMDALRTALEQPEQEPVKLHSPVISAWSLRDVYFDEDGEPSMHRSPPAAQPEQQTEPICPECKAAVLYECVACSSNNYPPKQQTEPVAYYHPHKGFYWAKPTYISAPIVVDVPPVPLYVKWIAAQRPWQGLTKVQKDDFADAYGSYEAVCAIEQALKERNT